MKKHFVKPTKQQLILMKNYWKYLQDELDAFYSSVNIIEKDMQKVVGIKDLMFYNVDGHFCGIGTYSRSIDLIQQEELEK